MWKKILAAQVMWLGLCTTSQALNDEQRAVLGDLATLHYLTRGCSAQSATKWNSPAVAALVIGQKLDNTQLFTSEEYKEPIAAAEKEAADKYSGLSEAHRCAMTANELFGEAGTRRAGLVVYEKKEEAPTGGSSATTSIPSDAKPRVVAAVDMELSPRKWMGQYVEMKNMRCMHADEGEYRCIEAGGDGAVIFAEAVKPSERQTYIERECGTFAEMVRDKCRFTLRFTPEKYDQDIVSGYEKRTIIMAQEIEAISPDTPTKKRRR